jgi:hypothetical protein
MPISLADHQLALVMAAAGPLDPHKRIVLMERIVGLLRLQGVHRPTDADVEFAFSRGLRELMQSPTA